MDNRNDLGRVLLFSGIALMAYVNWSFKNFMGREDPRYVPLGDVSNNRNSLCQLSVGVNQIFKPESGKTLSTDGRFAI